MRIEPRRTAGEAAWVCVGLGGRARRERRLTEGRTERGNPGRHLHTLSYEAYVYLYPLVTMDHSRTQGINLPTGSRPGYWAPNEFHHLREFPPADFPAVVRPNFDTLYSNAWLDLTAGPMSCQSWEANHRHRGS